MVCHLLAVRRLHCLPPGADAVLPAEARCGSWVGTARQSVGDVVFPVCDCVVVWCIHLRGEVPQDEVRDPVLYPEDEPHVWRAAGRPPDDPLGHPGRLLLGADPGLASAARDPDLGSARLDGGRARQALFGACQKCLSHPVDTRDLLLAPPLRARHAALLARHAQRQPGARGSARLRHRPPVRDFRAWQARQGQGSHSYGTSRRSARSERRRRC
mmetsp:Transcript_27131/g.90164  ORF Transcript_27131/g.90164 Transcript_27131/m.90164 type:complete len:214 (-) Transcript_27131:1126-1767(-)